jgi:hypothetical protein
MKSITMYHVYKFFPSRCPKCEQAFRSASNFGKWVGKGKSFVDALRNQRELFSDIFPKAESKDKTRHSNKFNIDFIVCQNCQNVTLRIDYAWRQVMTLEEARFLVETQGFTGWQEIEASGNMARPMGDLSMLGQVDLLMLQKAVIEAKHLATVEKDETIGADVFSAALDPALVGFVNKVRQVRTSALVRERLKGIFVNLWDNVSSDCKDFLVTAEVLKDEFMGWAETDPALDFTPAVQTYSVALEKEILDKIFHPFRDSASAKFLPEVTGQSSLDKSLEALKSFVDKKRKLTLGDMAFCLLNVGCKLRNSNNNGFVQFLQERLDSLDNFCDEESIPGRIIKYSQEYRNRAAHANRLSREECLEARAFLLDEPIRLLIALVEACKAVKP